MYCKRWRCLLLTALLIIVTGCSSIVNRDTKSVEQHPDTVGLQVAANSISDMETLTQAVMQLVQRTEASGTLTFSHYTGDIEADLAQACYEVSRETPLGAFAVDYMSFETPVIVSGTGRSTVFIRYKRTQAELASLPHVNTQQFRAQVASALTSYSQRLVVEMGYFNPADTDCKQLARQLFIDYPLWTTQLPDISVKTYPDNSIRCIVEVTFTYQQDIKTLTQQRDAAVAALVQRQPARPDTNDVPTQLTQLATLLTTSLQPDDTPINADQPGVPDSAYGALVKQKANTLGIALAFKAMSHRWNLPCRIVIGEKQGARAAWNLVQVADQWYHVDVSPPLSEQPAVLLKGDDAMTDYRWDKSKVPPAPADYAPPTD